MNPVERAVREEIAGNLAIMGMSREQIVQATRLSMEWVDYLVAVIRRKNEFWMRKQQPGSDS